MLQSKEPDHQYTFIYFLISFFFILFIMNIYDLVLDRYQWLFLFMNYLLCVNLFTGTV